MEEGERESEIRESTNEGNNDRYTQVENDVLFNPIEGYDENEGENTDNAGETKENEKAKKYIVDDGTKKKRIQKIENNNVGRSWSW